MTGYTLSVAGGFAGVTVTAIFTQSGASPPVVFDSVAGCAANQPNQVNQATGDPSTTVTCSPTSATVTINVKPQAVGTLNVVAGVVGTDYDSAMANNSDSATTAVNSGAPTISAVAPSSGPTSGGYSVVVSGTNLDGATSLTFGGAQATVQTDTATQIIAVVPPGTAGPASVFVVTSRGQNTFSGFTYLASLKFFGLPPCRLIDTRQAPGPYGGPALSGGAARSFTIVGQCGVSATAKAVVANFTVVGSTAAGTVLAYPSNLPSPKTGIVSYSTGQTIAGLATISLNASGALSVYPNQAAGTTVNLVLDIHGYFQ